MTQAIVPIAIIGGSGLYQMQGISDVTRHTVATPFGEPSSDIVIGTLGQQRVAFVARHGEGHFHPPSHVPYRANIYALKTLGVRFILGVNAVGSLREDYAPGHIVIPDQVIDYNLMRRERTFFDGHIVAHVSVAEPFDAYLRQTLTQAVRANGGTVHDSGTLLVEDGPRFATRAESHLFRQWGCSLIGMTTAPEAFLAREAEIAYATIAHVTDYDSWHTSEAPVTADAVIAQLQENIQLVEASLKHALTHLNSDTVSPAHTALSGAIVTAQSKMPAHELDALRPIVARALGL